MQDGRAAQVVVRCRVGSSEIPGQQRAVDWLVRCRVGSSEIGLDVRRSLDACSLPCRQLRNFVQALLLRFLRSLLYRQLGKKETCGS